MSNATVVNIIKLTQQVHPVFLFTFAVATLLGYFCILCNRIYWRNLEIILGISYVASFAFIDNLLLVWLGGAKGDALTKSFLQLVLLGMIGQATTFFFTKQSSDPVVRLSLSVSNIVGRGGLILSAVYALMFVNKMSMIALKGDCIFLSLLLIGDIVHLKKVSTKDGGICIGNAIRSRVIIDAILNFIIGITLLGFSSFFPSVMGLEMTYTSVSKVFMQSFGYQLLAGSVLSLSSLCYKDAEDVKSILLSKIVIYVPVLAVSLWNSFSVCYPGVIGVSTILTLNAGFSFFSSKEKDD